MTKGKTFATIKIQAKISPDSKELKKDAKKKKQEEKALRSKVNAMVQKTKTQIKQLYKVYGTSTPAVKALKERGTTLSVKGKNYQQLQSTYFSLDKFLKAQTSTVKGAEEVLNQTASIISDDKLDASDIKNLARDFFDIAHKAQEMLQIQEGFFGGSYRIFSAIREIQKQANSKWSQATSNTEKATIIADKLTVKQQETYQTNEMAKYVEQVEKGLENWMK